MIAAEPFPSAIASAVACSFGPGLLPGRIEGTFWPWSGQRAVLIAMGTVVPLLLVGA